MKKLVFVIDDDKSVRTSLANLLQSEAYEAETFASAMEYLSRTAHEGPACVVLDVTLPDLDGFALQQRLAERGGGEQVVFITGHGDIPMGVQAMKRGAVDFLPKPFDDDAFLRAVDLALIRATSERQQRGEVVELRSKIALLTPREFQVFRLVIAGLLNKQIADELGTALRTVKRQRGCVMQKLGVVSVAELVRIAQKAGVTALGPKAP